ncbi:hypothetical protein XH84_03070 [Bradyrhizobium nanningense]|nr:hypothetical protein XH84_03070 [Bradyrhizobium nanningense]TQF31924.1 hypothetical protein UNPA324_21620 [Bradyrhizobium sp. UNPA324]
MRVYRIRQATTTEAGTVTYGLSSLLSVLENLQPTDPLAVTVFATDGWFGSFCSDQADRLVGFVLVQRRSPKDEQERLEWFRQNLT